ncbi:hypothetical protein SAMN05444397_11532 [Flavobacterium aquidurense]|uniref:Uncharacterized protein n=1 Tax=Flavobacterium frigidimaris TaxID=262320 RepID=A0ABX4BKM0_FLAFR|nr:hypothetical protein B0A65_20900 [Flavobacterium frigidimaris]SDZ65723.1 hypothetical protein SAMN05444397_11532 [Flavobacterium aquidurense]
MIYGIQFFKNSSGYNRIDIEPYFYTFEINHYKLKEPPLKKNRTLSTLPIFNKSNICIPIN